MFYFLFTVFKFSKFLSCACRGKISNPLKIASNVTLNTNEFFLSCKCFALFSHTFHKRIIWPFQKSAGMLDKNTTLSVYL